MAGLEQPQWHGPDLEQDPQAPPEGRHGLLLHRQLLHARQRRARLPARPPGRQQLPIALEQVALRVRIRKLPSPAQAVCLRMGAGRRLIRLHDLAGSALCMGVWKPPCAPILLLICSA